MKDKNRYSRNRLYISEMNQKRIRETRILLGGAGIGSIIAECILRLGFETITIVDGDKVETTNLNRQNYISSDIGKYKAATLAKRLQKINPEANITFLNTFITNENVEEIIDGHDIAVNALDFCSDIPFVFDRICSDKGIPVLHPYNFGWAGLLAIVKPDGYQLTELSENYRGFELKVAEFVERYYSFWNDKQEWLDDIIKQVKNEKAQLPPPQLSIGSWIAASQCATAMYNIVTGNEVLYFPKFYLSTLLDNSKA